MPVELTRTVRFAIGADGSVADDAPVSNSFAAWPPMRGLGRYYEIHVTCTGEPDPRTGYLLNIKAIDQAVRQRALGIIAEATTDPNTSLGSLMQQLLHSLADHLDPCIINVTLQLTPTYALQMEAGQMDHVLVSQQFEFSAAHRLHVPSLSDEQNRQTFGKCNNPSGHGHNYRLEVTIRSPLDTCGRIASVEQIDELVDRVITGRFDHKHLNQDTEEFADINPSVEHIAKVIYDLLIEPVAAIGLSMACVRVWETGKTVCTYRG